MDGANIIIFWKFIDFVTQKKIINNISCDKGWKTIRIKKAYLRRNQHKDWQNISTNSFVNIRLVFTKLKTYVLKSFKKDNRLKYIRHLLNLHLYYATIIHLLGYGILTGMYHSSYFHRSRTVPTPFPHRSQIAPILATKWHRCGFGEAYVQQISI